jgi:hypothetical protein
MQGHKEKEKKKFMCIYLKQGELFSPFCDYLLSYLHNFYLKSLFFLKLQVSALRGNI